MPAFYIYADKNVVSRIPPRTNCWTTGCNTSQKHKGISIFKIHKPKSEIPEYIKLREERKNILFFS